MNKLTIRQQQVLDQIQKYLNNSGFPPTIAELAQALQIRSANAIRDHLRALERKGVIKLTAGASRGIRLCLQTENTSITLPIIGQLAVGTPILATKHIEGYQQIGHALFTPQPDYLLRIHGMSMCKSNILDGDLLVVHKTSVAQPGQIVVTQTNKKIIVGRFKQTLDMTHLFTENDDLLLDAELVVEGIGIGVIRNNLI